MVSVRFVISTADFRVDIVWILGLFLTAKPAFTTASRGIFKYDIKRQLLTDLQKIKSLFSDARTYAKRKCRRAIV